MIGRLALATALLTSCAAEWPDWLPEREPIEGWYHTEWAIIENTVDPDAPVGVETHHGQMASVLVMDDHAESVVVSLWPDLTMERNRSTGDTYGAFVKPSWFWSEEWAIGGRIWEGGFFFDARALIYTGEGYEGRIRWIIQGSRVP